MNEKQNYEMERKWTEDECREAEERQKQRFLAYMNSGLSMTKWIEEQRELKEQV